MSEANLVQLLGHINKANVYAYLISVLPYQLDRSRISTLADTIVQWHLAANLPKDTK